MASEIAVIAIGQAASACSPRVPNRPHDSFCVAGIFACWVVVIVGSMSVLAMTPLTRCRAQKPRLS